MTLSTYLPQDRLRALAHNTTLPERCVGAALFADLSGFTALTEKLTQQLGPRRGAEELSRQINAVYEVLIAEIEHHGGSVISFAGDGMMCWFDADARLETGDWRLEINLQSHGLAQSPISNSPVVALACAFALQTAMQAFPHLGLKVAVTTGPARRWVVGDPHIQQIDTLAGTTITRTATAEHLAQRGEVLTDEATASASTAPVAAWRTDPESGERFAVVNQLSVKSEELRVEREALKSAPAQRLRRNSTTLKFQISTFLLPALYARETSGQSVFLTEFRPCVVLFVRFVGIEFETDAAHAQLNAFICLAQRLAEQYGGTLLQVTIGDKGSYLYLNWGALSAHEDDARRAVKTALALRQSQALPLQMGLAKGVLRVGAYGGSTRRAYGALGDEVNLAARLMQTAAAGEIVVSNQVHKDVAQRFACEPRPPLFMRGKADPLPVFAITGQSQARASQLQAPTYALPLVGRQPEMQMVQEKLALAAAGQAQTLGLVAEAGLGKSRLVAEVIRAARKQGFVGYGGTGQSDGGNTPYLAWKPIWQAFFDVDATMPVRKQLRLLEGAIADYAPTHVEALPLLNAVLDLNIPDNGFTQNLEPKLRQSALHALLEDCLQAAAQEAPVLIVIEDWHWVDALTQDLLEQLAKALAQAPVCFVLAYRPLQLRRLSASRLAALPQFTKIELRELTTAEATQAIRAKLAQLYSARSGAVPPALVEKLMARAQGNPFYLEELLNYLHDRGLDPHDPAALGQLELPDSLHTLILSRIDQLSEREKNTLRVASIIGRLFRTHWLLGYYPTLGARPRVQAALGQLTALDLITLDTPAPELAYRFKHIVTHEVTYESLPFVTRAQLHEQLARYLENAYAATLPLEALAFHYGRSQNLAKQREYFRKAGEAAQRAYANAVALDYYGQLLPLLSATEQIEIYLQRGQVLELIGQWAEAESDYRAALASAGAVAPAPATAAAASAQFALGKLCCLRGDYELALEWLAQAQAARTALADPGALARVWLETGFTLHLKGDYAPARPALNTGLQLAREIGDKWSIALALNYLAAVVAAQGDAQVAQTLHTESLTLRREIGDMRGIAVSLNHLGNIAWAQGDYATAQALHTESLALKRKLGDKLGIAGSLNNLGNIAYTQGDYATTRAFYEQSLTLQREIGDKRGIANLLNNLGIIAYAQHDYAAAHKLHAESLTLQREIGDKWGMAKSLTNLGDLAYSQGDYTTAHTLFAESLTLAQEIGNKPEIAYARFGLGLVALATPHATPAEARQHLVQSLRLRQEIGNQLQQTSSLIGMAGLALRLGAPRHAAQLLGAAVAALAVLAAAMETEAQPLYTQTLAATQEQLNAATFNAAWAAGEKMSLEAAVRFALQEVSPDDRT